MLIWNLYYLPHPLSSVLLLSGNLLFKIFFINFINFINFILKTVFQQMGISFYPMTGLPFRNVAG